MTDLMRAVSQDRYGGPDVLRLVDVPRPEPIPTEVLVRVRAAGVNPVDFKTSSGGGISWTVENFPLILGWDVSGVVESVGYGVTRFKPGDEVFGMPRFPHLANAYAEYVTAPSRHFAHKPAGLTHVEAAGLPLAGLTAWQILVDTANVQRGQRVLIQAAAGGVGHLAVQIAKARGAYVIAIAREAKHAFVQELGADEVIDYTTADVGASVRDVDVAVDLIGGESTLGLASTLRRGGVLIDVTGGAGVDVHAAVAAAGTSVTGILVEPDGHALEQLGALVDSGQLRIAIDTVLPLEQAAKAHEISATGRVQGKIVLEVVH